MNVFFFFNEDKFQALIQMKDAVVAQAAKNSLHGQNIYSGCCTLHIDYSKLNTLNVKYNNEKFTDYLIISDKSNKQIQDFKKLVDILNMDDFKPYKLDEIIWLDNILLKQDGLYNTLSKELRAKFHHFISVISLTVTYNEIQSDKPKYEIMIKRFVQKVESLSNQIVKSDCEREKIEINNELVEISLNNQGWFMTTV